MAARADSVNRPPGRIRYGWPLDRASWAIVVELCSETAWGSRPLGQASRGSIPAESGVYVMCVRPPGAGSFAEPFMALHDVIYVGRSNNLRTRFAQHLNTPSPKVRAARATYAESLRFWFLKLPADRIVDAEHAFIECFGPPANDKPGEGFLLDPKTPRPVGFRSK